MFPWLHGRASTNRSCSVSQPDMSLDNIFFGYNQIINGKCKTIRRGLFFSTTIQMIKSYNYHRIHFNLSYASSGVTFGMLNEHYLSGHNDILFALTQVGIMSNCKFNEEMFSFTSFKWLTLFEADMNNVLRLFFKTFCQSYLRVHTYQFYCSNCLICRTM